MEEFHIYAPEEVIGKNLHELSRRYDRICEQELAHIRELAGELLLEGNNSLIEALPDHTPPSFDSNEDLLPQNAGTVQKMRQDRHNIHAWLLSRELSRKKDGNPQDLLNLLFDGDSVPDSAKGRIVYQKSAYADDAYLTFASHIRDASAVVAQSFPAACEEVYNGMSEYCILPVENSAEGPLTGFLKLSVQYSLYTVASCDILSRSKEKSTRFALLAKHHLPTREFGTGYLDIILPLSLNSGVHAILSASELCGLTLFRANTLPAPFGENDPYLYLVFNTLNGDIPTFLVYLKMQSPLARVSGIYPHFSQLKGS